MGVMGMAAAMVAAQLRIAALQASLEGYDAMREEVELQRMEIAELEAREPETVYLPAESRECGTCGAHVLEWWYVTSFRGDLVEVCHDCKLLFDEAEENGRL